MDYVVNVDNKLREFIKLPFKEKTIIHLHSSKFIVLFLLFILGRKHEIGLTVHNQRLVNGKSLINKWFLSLFLNQLKFFIINDPKYREVFVDFFGLKKSKVHLLPAYIKPMAHERVPLSKKILQFRDDKEFLISANAFMLRFYNGIDLYGLDMLIDLVEKIKNNNINVGLIFCLPQIGDRKYYQRILKTIKTKGIDMEILIIQEMLPNAFQVWEISDLFIRPTSTDIEGISVKEALDFETLVIASDVCERPKKTILFKNRDFNDLYEKTLEVYKSLRNETKNFNINNEVDSTIKIYKIYKSLM